MKIDVIIDSGSETKCPSERFFTENKELCKKFPITPVKGQEVRGAILYKLAKITKPRMLPVNFLKGKKLDMVYAFVQSLISEDSVD